jgi:hypothetical protein
MKTLEELRYTGRTTRMLEHAKKLDREGRAVYVVVANMNEILRVERLLGADIGGIKVETETSLGNLDWQTMRMLGAHPNCVVLVDHFVIESRFAKALAMLHAYDL